ncbi:glycosyltransferase [Streptomyces sp. SID12501]|uniref:Glycosyltransferase family 4 protein n=1 Tax=Streptomyces sp. SID12501 TaxID=2706042 RepID=A0A6B3C166_9ACTN|nr:glycosyltransferase family 4 protein [Streptomyces sp. SID12501]
MRIAHYSDTPLHRADGVAQVVRLTTQLLRSAGDEVVVVAPSEASTNDFVAGCSAVRSVPFPGLDYRIPIFFSLRKAHSAVDVIHIHTLGPIGLSGIRGAIRSRTPIVITWHTDYVSYEEYYSEIGWAAKIWSILKMSRAKASESQPGTSLVACALLNAMNAADAVIVLSEKSELQLSGMGVGTRVARLPSPVDVKVPLEDEVARLRASLGLRSPAKVVLGVGRLRKEKSWDLLIQAFVQLRKNNPNSHLLLIGEGRHRAELWRSVIGFGLQEHVTILQPVPHHQMGAVFALADVLCHTSDTETQGLVLDEAECLGIPVVVTDPYLTMGGKRILSDKSPDGLADTLHRVISGRTYRPQISADAYNATQRYKSANYIIRLRNLYDQVSRPCSEAVEPPTSID